MNPAWNLVRYLSLARRYLRDGRLPAVLLAVALKSGKQGGQFASLKEDLRLLQNLSLAWWRGEYRAIAPRALVAVVAALLYFLAPLDALPDWLPGLGLVDDLAVLAWVLSTWREELAAFRVWRQAQAQEKLARIERLPDVEPLPLDQLPG